MQGGEWIWILLALFGIFRLLLLAGKKKGATPVTPLPPGSLPPPREEVDELKLFIDSLTNQFGSRPPVSPVQPPRPSPRTEKVSLVPPRPSSPPPVVAPTHPAPAEFYFFSGHPVVQGIIFSEILGPPPGLPGAGAGPENPGNFQL